MKRNALYFSILVILLLTVFFCDLFVGNAHISIGETWAALWGSSGDVIIDEIVRNYRMPKALTSILAGASLSVAGLLMQTLFRNPLAGPDVLGVSAGAGLGVAILTMLNGSFLYPIISSLGSMSQVIAAIAGAALTLLLILFVSSRINDSITILVLGMIFGYVASAAITILQSFADPDSLKVFVTWTFGSTSNVTWSKMPIMAGIVIIGILSSFFLQKNLNSLLLGEHYASTVGLNIKSTRIVLITITALVTGTITAFTGPIAFVGVVIPHFARALFGTVNHRIVIPATLLSGSILMIICDIISQIPVSNRTLPINAVTALFGAPMIIWIVLKRKKL